MNDNFLLSCLLMVITGLCAVSGFQLCQLPHTPVPIVQEGEICFDMILTTPSARDCVEGSIQLE